MPARHRYGAIAALLLWTVSMACMASDFESALREADRVRSSEPARFLELLDELDGRQSEADEGQRQRLAYLDAFRKVVYDNATQAGIEQRSEEHTSELQSLMRISYAVFCMKKKNIIPRINRPDNQNP